MYTSWLQNLPEFTNSGQIEIQNAKGLSQTSFQNTMETAKMAIV
jgi:hypothetical protein